MDWTLFQLVMILGLIFIGFTMTIINILKKILTALQWIHVILTNMSERWNEKVRASEDLAERKLRLQRDRDAGISDE